MPKIPPSKSVKNGHDTRGRFAPGNKAAKGNSIPHKAAAFRARLFAAVTFADFEAVTRKLVEDAKAGQNWAVRLLFAYLLGEPAAIDVLAELERQRQIIETLSNNHAED